MAASAPGGDIMPVEPLEPVGRKPGGKPRAQSQGHMGRRTIGAGEQVIVLGVARRGIDDPRTAGLAQRLVAGEGGGDIVFLIQRIGQMGEFRQADMFSDVRVSDFLMQKDRLFAEITLDRDEMALYDKVYQTMAVEAPVPDLVVYLQAPVDTLMFRVAQRGIAYEQRISRSYLERLAESYARFFHDYDEAPLLIVNAATIDPIHNDDHYEMLLEQIHRIRSGRHFFNPLVSALA